MSTRRPSLPANISARASSDKPNAAAVERRRKGERTYFNVLRVGAAQMVLVGHVLSIGVPWTRKTDLPYIQAFGVVLLIMISGYLIAGSVRRRIHERTYTFWSFMRDRGVRIFVPLLPIIPAVLLFDWLMRPQGGYAGIAPDHSPWSIVATSLMLADNPLFRQLDQWFGTDLFVRAVGTDAPLWAVALAWWLYVAFAGLVSLIFMWRASRFRALIVVVTCFAVLTVVYSMVFGNWRPLGWIVTAGCGWFAVYLAKLPRWAWGILALFGIGLVIYGMTCLPRGVYMPPTAIGAGLAIVSIYKSLPLGWLSTISRPIAFMARYSYSLFLVHYPIAIYMKFNGFPLGWKFVICAILVSHMIALAWWALFERHAPVIREKIERFQSAKIGIDAPTSPN